jgi:cell division protein FtsL
MMRLNLVLLLAVLVSALYLVSVQYESRRLFSELDRRKVRLCAWNTEWERLQVEKRAQATPARVERLGPRTAADAPGLACHHDLRRLHAPGHVLAESGQTVRAATEVGKTTR